MAYTSDPVFFLALTFGLTDDPPAAVARAVGFTEKVGRSRGARTRPSRSSRPPTSEGTVLG